MIAYFIAYGITEAEILALSSEVERRARGRVASRESEKKREREGGGER